MIEKYSLRKIENLHIPLWLLKDTCWMMEWKMLGVIMIVPTVSFALVIAYITRKENEFLLNCAICFWIIANAYWMACEFFSHADMKYYASIPFGIGLFCTALFYILKRRIIE